MVPHRYDEFRPLVEVIAPPLLRVQLFMSSGLYRGDRVHDRGDPGGTSAGFSQPFCKAISLETHDYRAIRGQSRVQYPMYTRVF